MIPSPNWAPAAIGRCRCCGGIEVDVDHAIEERHGAANRRGQLLEIEDAAIDVAREVDGTEIADGGFRLRSDFGDFGAEIREMNDILRQAGLVRFAVAGIFKHHPAVAGFRQHAHHSRVKIPGFDLALEELRIFRRDVGAPEFFAVEIREMRNLRRVEERPISIGLHPFHKDIGNPVGKVQIVSAPRFIACVVA